jgi:hypothetical protein
MAPSRHQHGEALRTRAPAPRRGHGLVRRAEAAVRERVSQPSLRSAQCFEQRIDSAQSGRPEASAHEGGGAPRPPRGSRARSPGSARSVAARAPPRRSSSRTAASTSSRGSPPRAPASAPTAGPRSEQAVHEPQHLPAARAMPVTAAACSRGSPAAAATGPGPASLSACDVVAGGGEDGVHVVGLRGRRARAIGVHPEVQQRSLRGRGRVGIGSAGLRT